MGIYTCYFLVIPDFFEHEQNHSSTIMVHIYLASELSLKSLYGEFFYFSVNWESANCEYESLQLLIHEFIKYSSQFAVSLLGNTANSEGFSKKVCELGIFKK